MKREKVTKGFKKNLIKNSFWSFSATLLNRIGALIFAIILARFLMPEGYGIYSIVFSTIMIFYTFADLGVNSTLLRYLSLALAKNKKQIPSYYRYLLKIKFILMSIIFILLIILAYPLSFFIFKNSELFIPFLAGSFFILVLAFEVFHTQIFYSIEKVEYISLKELLTQILRIIFLFFIFYFISRSYQIIGIFISLFLVHALILILALFYLRKFLPKLYTKPKINIDKKRIKKFIGFLTIASISAVFFSHIDSIMLGFFLLPSYVGYYKAAFSLILGISAIVSFPASMLLPVFTKLNLLDTEKILKKILFYISFLAIPCTLGLLVLGRFFIKTIYGESYLPAMLPFNFLVFLIFPIASIAIIISFFAAREQPQIFAKLIIITSIINIFLNIFFIKLLLNISPLWATAGAGIATLISWLFYFFTAIYILKKKFNFKIPLNHLIKPIISSLIMAGILFITLSFIKELNIILGIFLVLLGFLIYILIMILIKGIKKEDLDLIRLLINKD